MRLVALLVFIAATDAIESERGPALPLTCDAKKAAAWNAQNGARQNNFTFTATANLVAAKSALDAISVPFFLAEGTLLGWFRNCMPIPWDTDLDLVSGQLPLPVKYLTIPD